MDRFSAMEVFVRIVEKGSLSAVARELGTTQPSVSRQLRALERQLKTQVRAFVEYLEEQFKKLPGFAALPSGGTRC